MLLVRTRVGELSGARVRFVYEIYREVDNRLLAEGQTLLASLNPEGRPCRLPRKVREGLSEAVDTGT